MKLQTTNRKTVKHKKAISKNQPSHEYKKTDISNYKFKYRTRISKTRFWRELEKNLDLYIANRTAVTTAKQDIMIESLNYIIIQTMHTLISTTKKLIDSQVNYCSELKMNQVNKDNAELVILTAEETLQSLSIKRKQIKKVMNGSKISESTEKKEEENLQW